MKPIPVLESDFYHDGRGPELERIVFANNGRRLVGFEYINPDEEGLRHLKVGGLEAYAVATDEVHGNVVITSSKAAIHNLGKSSWLRSHDPRHLERCSHFQVVFYDEVFDLLCHELSAGDGGIGDEEAV